MQPDESGAAGDECLHALTFLILGSKAIHQRPSRSAAVGQEFERRRVLHIAGDAGLAAVRIETSTGGPRSSGGRRSTSRQAPGTPERQRFLDERECVVGEHRNPHARNRRRQSARKYALRTPSRPGYATELANASDDQPDPSDEAEHARVEEDAQPLIVEDRGVTEGILLASLPRAETLTQKWLATHSVLDPRDEVGATTDESRITGKRLLLGNEALTPIRARRGS